ncbi:hypothetical protein [Frankia tisae]|uniref:hypothetical protein n=1 Tax=Frankia tisae TaxID=2950104 RepID=UPI0021BF548A|nr:hypothetical protein [Frankia tisae]
MGSRSKAKPWTLVGAARAAREARIATAEYLRHARVARPWEMNRLLSAFQLHAAHLGDEQAALMMLFTGMGYRPPFPTDWQQATELVLTDEARYLDEAELYVLSPQMCDVALAATATLTAQDLQLLDVDDLPSPRGLVILPYPVVTASINGDLSDLRAFTWRSPATILDPSPKSRWTKELPAVRMSSYHDTHGPVRPDSFLNFAARARAQGTPLPPLLLDAVRLFPFRYADGAPEALRQFAATARRIGEQTRRFDRESGVEEERVVGEYTPGSQISDQDDLFAIRFLYAFWRLCDQRLVTLEPAEVNHSARVVAQRAGISPDVRVPAAPDDLASGR